MRHHPGAALAVLAVIVFAGSSYGVAACASDTPHAKAQPVTAVRPSSEVPDDGSSVPPASGGPSAKPRSSPRPSASGSPSPAPRRPVNALGPAGSRKSTGSTAVALTFDDGPDPVNTPAMLDLLKQRGVKATFCLVGWRARDNPDVVRRIVAEGHTLCNHSWQHLEDLGQRDEAYIRHDLQATNEAIHAAVPDAKISYFRAPFGNFTPLLVSIAREFGMTSIHWDVDDQTWMTSTYGVGQAMTDHIRYEVQTFTRPGSIILSHDNKKPHTITAYTTVLPWLQQHFTLIPLPV
jgi:peptidoglycan/xylan/chitin deacetylase (PgdA/CDA1 family)